MLNVPLAIRLATAKGDKHVTRRLRDLTLRKVAPGGFAAATLTFDQPLAVSDPEVGLYGKCVVSDGRNGKTVWEGRQEDPGRGASSNGQVWSLTCFGPSEFAQDNPLTVCYVDTGIEAFQATTGGLGTAVFAATDDTPPKIKVAIPNGAVLGNGTAGVAINRLLEDCGQKLARYSAAWSAGVTDANFQVALGTRPSISGTVTLVKTANLNTAGGTLAAVITTDIPAGDDICDFRLRHNAAAATNLDDVHWISASTVLQGTRYTATGSEQTTGATYNTDTLTSDQIVNDLLGRTLGTLFDGALASVTAGATAIDRLVYVDPVPPAQILDDLMAVEGSAYYWAAWESTVNGKARFEWSIWPTVVRYETSINGTFDSPGNAGELFNRVIVRYQDTNGRTRTVIRTKAQADLDAAGLTRTAVIDLSDAAGTAANARAAGDRYLTDHNSVPNAGTLDVSTPILDLISGRMVAPWEIVPGNLIRVRGVLPRVDALNATDRDAVTVFRLVSTDYTASTNTCQLGLDSPARTVENQIVAAHRKIDRRRRR